MSSASLYTSMAGLQAITADMQATSANLANVQTTGYSAVQAAVEAAPYTGSNAPGGADAVALTPNPDLSAGPLQHTGSPLDVAVSGDAWLEVQTPAGNAISRNGSLQITNAGILADNAGNPVLSTTGQPISLPRLAKLEIGADGTVSGVPANSTSGQSQVYGQINIVATPPGTLTPLSGAMFAAPAGALQPAATGTLEQGYLNGSNVDPTKTMINMIADSRSYQVQSNLMKTQAGGGQALNSLVAQG
ncbi:MAG TPA: flagellar hook-basal body complex protein [Acidocella sp.]|jgi:flagellar basal-body rod protein FlgF|uniref:flagellar hook-basal body complex protein n=1 Tax=Acidocella sp. TaxID=50710 RepID=UPI002C1A9264|nr:flagellar hook-basal body complex protein [Acidocella sp.]HVE21985.1 flagellar hook-basal body complex protein [Acidocella sp.]